TMMQQGVTCLHEDGFDDADIVVERSMEMRYRGQIHECTVTIPNGVIDAALMAEILEAFHLRHEALFTYAERDNPVELVNVEVTVRGAVTKPDIPTIAAAEGPVSAALSGRRDMIMGADYAWTQTPVYDGALLGAGHSVQGPALIEEPTTTIVVKPGWRADLHASGTYLLRPC
ncbi:MAG: hydantoinase/oxoprolinase family protein, partial [Neisseriaceae bacterium]|nr:hydantoinase/oxoprolinase family protein [Neisseriaceae bacterium]